MAEERDRVRVELHALNAAVAHRLRRRFDNEEVTDEDFENAIELPAMNDMRRDGRNDPFERTRGVIG